MATNKNKDKAPELNIPETEAILRVPMHRSAG